MQHDFLPAWVLSSTVLSTLEHGPYHSFILCKLSYCFLGGTGIPRGNEHNWPTATAKSPLQQVAHRAMAPAKKTTFKPLSPCFIQHLHFASAIAATTWGFLRTTEQPVWSKLHILRTHRQALYEESQVSPNRAMTICWRSSLRLALFGPERGCLRWMRTVRSNDAGAWTLRQNNSSKSP